MKLWYIVETDNFGGDYPNESFVKLTFWSEEDAQYVADAINFIKCKNDSPRYWKVVEEGYTLLPGFEP